MLLLAATLLCSLDTGIDPSCMRTSVNVSTSTSTLSSIAKRTDNVLDVTKSWQDRNEFDVYLPFNDRLSISNFATASGAGDVGLSYQRRIDATPRRWDQTIGMNVSLPTGALTFTNGRAIVAPTYSLSYHARTGLSLVGTADYAFPTGGTRLPFAPMTQRFDLDGRMLAGNRHGVFGTLGAGL